MEECCHQTGSGNSSMIAIISLISMAGRCTRTPAVIRSHTYTHPEMPSWEKRIQRWIHDLWTRIDRKSRGQGGFLYSRSCRQCMTMVLPRRRLTHCVIMSGVAGVCVWDRKARVRIGWANIRPLEMGYIMLWLLQYLLTLSSQQPVSDNHKYFNVNLQLKLCCTLLFESEQRS